MQPYTDCCGHPDEYRARDAEVCGRVAMFLRYAPLYIDIYMLALRAERDAAALHVSLRRRR